MMQYYFNELDPVSFQRLVNDVLAAEYGEKLITGPLRGRDGGLDAEAVTDDGKRILFQVKHHATQHGDLARIRTDVIGDFQRELKKNVLTRADRKVDHFILITNVPSSDAALKSLARQRLALLSDRSKLRADVWWESDFIAHLDRHPQIWPAHPQMFAGGRVPILGEILRGGSTRSAAAVLRAAIATEYASDRLIHFQQTQLDREIARLFVPVDADFRWPIVRVEAGSRLANGPAIALLLGDTPSLSQLLIEAGPGHGKSTLTQMVAQIYRQRILGRNDFTPEDRWTEPLVTRVPLRIELRKYATQLASASLEECLAASIRKASGGQTFTADDVAELIATSPTILLLDGLDEIGSDAQRDAAIAAVGATIARAGAERGSDCKVVLTTRPPAMAGRRDQLPSFRSIPLVSLTPKQIAEYVSRWTAVNLSEEQAAFVRNSFNERRREPHVQALARNPMQLAVLLHFIHMKGAAFPKRRAELYRDYFKSVIDRDVEKSPALAEKRDLVEDLHKHLAFLLHAHAESDNPSGTIARKAILRLTNEWLRQRQESIVAEDLFRLGEERLGLIVSTSGTGEGTTYGFDVQPVREYFAAAYFDNQIEGNAHDIFEELVPRPFWREVAVFLAGLRRTNERADLLERLRRVDTHPHCGWLHLGRAMALQLIEGGVFTEPKYLLDSAIDFVLDLFDRELLPPSVEPEQLALRLRRIVRPELAKVRQRILRLLQRHVTSPDITGTQHLFLIADGVLDPAELRDWMLSYHPANPNSIAAVRVDAVAKRALDLRDASANEGFWSVAPDAVWVDQLLTYSSYSADVRDLHIPTRLHPLLLEQLPFRRQVWPLDDFRSRSNWLVWSLLAFDNLADAADGYTPGKLHAQAEELQRSVAKAGFDGLSEDVARPLHELLTASVEVVVASPSEVDGRAAHMLAATKKACETDGIVSAVAAWHSAAMLMMPILEDRVRWRKQLLATVGPFFSTQEIEVATRSSEILLRSTVKNIRRGNHMIDLTRDVATMADNRTSPPYAFLRRIPLPVEALDLTQHLSEPLLRIARVQRFFREDAYWQPSRRVTNELAVSLTSSPDEETLQGLFALVDVCAAGVIHVQSIPALLDALARDVSGVHAENVLRALANPDAVLDGILETPERFASAYVSLAAAHRTNRLRVQFGPLLDREEDLGLREGQRPSK